MSDLSQGPGWWQASDGRWYPPESAPGYAPPPPPPTSAPRRRRWLLPVAVIAVIAVAGAAVGALLLGSSDDVEAATVDLEPVESTGLDPFTDSVTITEVVTFPEDVKAVATEVSAEFVADAATGTMVANGGTAGLYGGTKNDSVCDVAKLNDFLGDNPDKGRAWAAVAGISTDVLPEFLAGLSPVILTSDTWVTNHGFKNGKATPRSAVLQAGTAVLVDDTGTPRARCSCGNPLSAPPSKNLADSRVTGTRWAGYSTSSVTFVQGGDPASSLTLVDVETADKFQEPVGPPAAVTTTTAGTAATPVTVDELMNLSMPGLDGGPQIDLVNGAWASPDGYGGSEVVGTTLGDLDGDGVGDGVVQISSNGGGNMAWTTIVVLLADGRKQVNVDYGTGIAEPNYVGGATDPAIADGNLTLEVTAYTPADPRCCPSEFYVETLRYDGTTFRSTSLAPMPNGD